MKYQTIIAAVLLSGCMSTGPLSVVYKEGSSRTERQVAVDDCRVEALGKVPQAMATNYSPGYSSPGTTICSGTGYSVVCNQVGAMNIPATATTVDVNQDLRTRIIQRCMMAKGFDFIQAPRCTSEADKTRAAAFELNQPPRNQITCWGVGGQL